MFVYLTVPRLFKYRFGDLHIKCPAEDIRTLAEVFLLDVYRTYLIRRGDSVLDLGAGTGDFCIIASRKVQNEGRVIAIEPNPQDFKILVENIEENNCKNVVAINVGVANTRGYRDISYSRKNFRCKIDTLERILNTLDIDKTLDFIKMDIEGAEIEVVSSSMRLISQSRVLSLEFHGTKHELDRLIVPYGYYFYPITMSHICKNIVYNSLMFFSSFAKSLPTFIIQNREYIYQMFTGFEITKESLLNGSYLKDEFQTTYPIYK